MAWAAAGSAVLFIALKISLIIYLGTDATGWRPFYWDLGVALATGLLVGALPVRAARIAIFGIAGLLYCLDIHTAITAGDFADWTALRYLKNAGDLRDNAIADFPYMSYGIAFCLTAAYGWIVWTGRDMRRPAQTDHRALVTTALILAAVVMTGAAPQLPMTPVYRNPFEYLATASAVDESEAVPTPAFEDMDVGTLTAETTTFNFRSKYRFATYRPIPHRRPKRPHKLNTVVVLLESTTLHSMNGKEKEVLPTFWRLAQHGVFFKNFYANCPLSLKSILALHAGVDPAANWDYISKSRPRLPLKTIAEYFKKEGYATALLHGGKFSFSKKLAYLKNRGYDILYDAKSLPNKKGYHTTSWGIDDRAEFTFGALWAQEQVEKNKPFFITFIPIAPHAPYDIPDPSWKQRQWAKNKKQNGYLNASAYVDSLLGEFVDHLKKIGAYEDTIFVVVGDHGEAFNQHPGNLAHSAEIYEENVHVPLVIANPTIFPKPVTSPVLGSHKDILPTLRYLLGWRQPYFGTGANLFSVTAWNRQVFFYTKLRGQKRGLRDGYFKYIHRISEDRDELYDLRTDPGETHNLAAKYPDKVAYFDARTRAWRVFSQNLILYADAKGNIPRFDTRGVVALTDLPMYFAAPKYVIKKHRSYLGKPFKIAGKTYSTYGFGVHANNIMVFDVSKYRGQTFVALFGKDGNTPLNTKVQPQVWMDGKVVFDGPVMNRNTPAITIRVPITGRYLALVVTDGGDERKGDHANWIEPHIEATPAR